MSVLGISSSNSTQNCENPSDKKAEKRLPFSLSKEDLSRPQTEQVLAVKVSTLTQVEEDSTAKKTTNCFPRAPSNVKVKFKDLSDDALIAYAQSGDASAKVDKELQKRTLDRTTPIDRAYTMAQLIGNSSMQTDVLRDILNRKEITKELKNKILLDFSKS